jgi:hypothetical protein
MVKNEERNLPRCLDSVRPGRRDHCGRYRFDGSNPDIAAGYGAEVIPFDFTSPILPRPAITPLRAPGGRWILVLDADETLDPASAPAIESCSSLSTKTRDISWSGAITRRIPNSPITDYVSGSFPTGRITDTAAGSMKPSTPRFCPEAGACRRPPSASITIFLPDREDTAPQEPLVHRDSEGRDCRRPERRLAARLSRRGISPARNVRGSHRIAERIVRVRPLDPRAHLFLGMYHLLYKPDPRGRAPISPGAEAAPGLPRSPVFPRSLSSSANA